MATTASKSRSLLIAALVVGLVVGIGAALLFSNLRSDPTPVATTSGNTRDADPEALADLPEPDAPIAADQADDPETALRGFLALEAAGDWEQSYEFLTDDLRTTAYTSAASWVSSHADVPAVTAYRVDDVAEDDEAGTAQVTTLTGFDAKLDPIIGLVAARGRTTWNLERNDDGLWRVATNATENTFLYPDSEGATSAARNWTDARVACDETTELESGLIGTPSLAQSLCSEDQDSPVDIGPVGPLNDSGDVGALISEFGPSVFTWARTATVQAQTPLTVVMAPIGSEWRVVATIPAR